MGAKATPAPHHSAISDEASPQTTLTPDCELSAARCEMIIKAIWNWNWKTEFE